MKRPSIETLFVRGGVAALLVAGAVWPTGAQVVPVAPARPVVKDTTVIMRILDGSRIPDSLRVLIRAFDTEPFSSSQSARIAQELEAFARMGFGTGVRVQQGSSGRGSYIVVTSPDGIKGTIGPSRGWIGLTTGGFHNEWSDGQFIQYLDYPPIVTVARPSPAQAAGIVPGDTLVAYDGVDVVAHRIDVAQLLMPDKKVAVTIRRDGENKAFTLTVARTPNRIFSRRLLPGEPPLAGFPGMVSVSGDVPRAGSVATGGRFEVPAGAAMPMGQLFFTSTGLLGASLSSVSADAARVLKIEPGVLVNEVPDGTPAFVYGLRAGDVIISVGGQAVASVDEFRRLAVLRGENQPVTLQIIRDKKPKSIIVK